MFKQFFASPTFEDDEKSRIAHILNVILWSILGMVTALVLIRFFFDYEGFSESIFITGAILALVLIVQMVMRFGDIKTASQLLLSLGWLGLTLQAWLGTDGIWDTAFLACIIIILLANLLLSWRVGLFFAVITVLAGWALALTQGSEPEFDEAVSVALDVTVIFFLVTIILTLTTTGLKNALQQVRQSETSLAERNRELKKLSQSLEQRIARRTKRLELVTQLSERLSAILDLNQLLDEVVNQVQENFGYYHVQIYMLDDSRQHLWLAAGAGEIGRRMKAEGVRLAIEVSTGLMAQAVRSRRIILITNVQESPGWLPHPLLPRTRSEMAVPIILEGQPVGVLNIQSGSVDGLVEEDKNIIRSLANQMAVAIRNAQLFEHVESALAQAHATQAHYVEQSWGKRKVDSSGSEYVYTPEHIALLAEDKQQLLTDVEQQALDNKRPTLVDLADTGSAGTSLVTPITLRDQTIGSLQLHTTADDKSWSEDDMAVVEAVVDQLAQTAENLRLFDETRNRAGREQTIREITEKIRAAPNLEELLKIASEELGERFKAKYTKLELGFETELDEVI